ncbi:hypothetical protein P8452_63246 [Trifolium repens]|nr:hypothetical protein P8452_63246 [Trifolium repens]
MKKMRLHEEIEQCLFQKKVKAFNFDYGPRSNDLEKEQVYENEYKDLKSIFKVDDLNSFLATREIHSDLCGCLLFKGLLGGWN